LPCGDTSGIPGWAEAIGFGSLENDLVTRLRRDYMISSAKPIKHKIMVRNDVCCRQHSVVSCKGV
jgi:hypothetical protein